MKKQLKTFAITLLALIPISCRATEETSTMPHKKHPIVTMETTLGEIKIELNSEKAPVTVKNFITYVREGHYNNTIFHRVIPDFMIQGGGFTKEMSQKPVHAPIVNEANNGLKNDRGTISMARTGVINSATAQFFINVVDNKPLDFRNETASGYGYAVFGKVIKGMDVVDMIVDAKTASKEGHQNVPVEPIIIFTATVKD